MTRATAASLLMKRLGRRTNLDTDVIAELQHAQSDLELGEFLPWFLTKALSGLATVASERAVVLPSDFIRETEHKWWLGASDGVKRLYKGDYDELYTRELFDVDYLSSCYYAIVGTSLYNFPVPTSVMSITGFYFAQAATLDADETENVWLKYAPGLLVARAGIRMAKTLRDPEAHELFKEDYAEAYNKLIAADTARQQAAYNAVMGG